MTNNEMYLFQLKEKLLNYKILNTNLNTNHKTSMFKIQKNFLHNKERKQLKLKIFHNKELN